MTKVKQEAELNKDIIFGDFNDTFYNLPFKVEAGFKWAYKHCSCDFYLKSDDNVFINLPKVFSLLRKETKSKKLYLGNRHSIEGSHREGKYIVTKKEYAKKRYPPFISGGAILFSNDAVKDLIPYFKKKPFKLDDVYIGMLAINAGITASHSDNFMVYERNTCSYDNNAFIFHIGKGIPSRETCMQRMFDNMINANNKNSFMETHYRRV